MLNSAAVGTVRLKQALLTAFEVVLERLATDATENHLLFVKAFEQNNIAHRVMLCIFTRKCKLSLVQHPEHTKYAGDRRPLNILLAAFKTRNRWSTDTVK